MVGAGRAIEICRALSSEPPGDVRLSPADTDGAALLLDWLALEARPRVICDLALRVAWSNTAADDGFGGGDLAIVEGVLTASTPAHQAMLYAFVRGCGATPGTLVLPRQAGDGLLVLHGRRIGSGSGDDGGYVGLILAVSGPGFAPCYGEFAKVFQLTAAEQKVLWQMIEGNTADAIAEAMTLSVETVRTHIRHLYTKIGVTSREGLFARISPFRLTEEEGLPNS